MSSSDADLPSFDGRTLVGVSNTADGEVDDTTVFTDHQDAGLAGGEYSGGIVALGGLAGTRDAVKVDVRDVHVSRDGSTRSGRGHAQLELLPERRLRSDETWQWASRPGAGRSIVEEQVP